MAQSKNQVEIDPELLAEARRMDIDAATVAERALQREIRARRSAAENAEADRKWREDNAEAIEWSNRYLEQHGFPFPQYRRY